jgi:hypothetical protein
LRAQDGALPAPHPSLAFDAAMSAGPTRLSIKYDRRQLELFALSGKLGIANDVAF